MQQTPAATPSIRSSLGGASGPWKTRKTANVFPTCGWGALFSAAAWFCWFFLLLQKVSEEVLCVMCEPRFGTGELENKGKPILCPQLCERWFNACKEEFVSASPSGSGSALTFCEDSSLICSRLSSSVPTASFGAAPKRSESSSGYSRRGETQEDWQGWFRGIGFVVFEVLSRPEVWLLLLVLGFLLNQLVQQARDIMLTQMQEEKLQRRQQILQRYGVEEEEEEIESVGAADEKDSADSSGEAKEETERVEALRSSLQHSKPAEEHS
ncbi:hypothetical protein, conserved [Eimeria acervulina]|uniref:Folate receptor-like domain-containing protein n=1 Tax=Eimeria acervulina TaxID=5801 RepID=U6GG47_EIMAC|nr:hypothetical protein, conserved [Eimeria acervulina]CDI79231.1 hypothetical protein, conserved [Eimeria acervulina]